MIRLPISLRGSQLAALLLRSMGIASSVAASAACGGMVVLEVDGESGGGGGTSVTGSGTATTATDSSAAGDGGAASTTSQGPTASVTGSANSSGTGTTCDAVPPPGEELRYACFDHTGGACPDAASAVVYEQLTAALSDLGCGGFKISSVPCGPEPGGLGQCCYHAMGVVLECGGRPFVVDGAARTADPVARFDWLVALAPDVSELDADVRSSLARAWTRDALDEHASVASFARFTLELLRVGAPAELVSLAQRAMGDEIRHAELCFGLASAYGGSPVGPSPLETRGSPSARSTLADIAAAAVREGCVGETVAAFIAGAARDGATDPAVRRVLGVIAGDESSHAALAWRFVAWAVRQGDADVVRAVDQAFAAALASSPLGQPEDGVASSHRASHGQLSATARRELAAQALAEVVRPCALALATEPRTRRGSKEDVGRAPIDSSSRPNATDNAPC